MTKTATATKAMVDHGKLPEPRDIPDILEEMETGKVTLVQIAAFLMALYMLKRKSLGVTE